MTRAIRKQPASATVHPIEIVHILATQPRLRESFPVAETIDEWVRWSA